METSAKKARWIGPFSKPGVLTKVDGRSREARRLLAIETQFGEHIGGDPTVVQAALIHRTAWLLILSEKLDERLVDGEFTEKIMRQYVCWQNAIARNLQVLGLKETVKGGPSLGEVLTGGAAS